MINNPIIILNAPLHITHNKQDANLSIICDTLCKYTSIFLKDCLLAKCILVAGHEEYKTTLHNEATRTNLTISFSKFTNLFKQKNRKSNNATTYLLAM